MSFFKNNFQFIVIVILILLLFSERIFKESPKPIVIRDTTYVTLTPETTIITQPTIIKTIPGPKEYIKDTLFIPDTTYKGLLNQYTELLNQYTSVTVSRDSLTIRDIGSVQVTDSTQFNKIIGRSWDYSFKIPTIREQILKAPVHQFYIGGGINGNKVHPISTMEGSIIWKNKKDQLYQFRAGTDFSNNYFGISTYWKIKLK